MSIEEYILRGIEWSENTRISGHMVRVPSSNMGWSMCPQFEFGGSVELGRRDASGQDDKNEIRKNCMNVLTNNPYSFGKGDEQAEYRAKLAPLQALPTKRYGGGV